MPADARCICDVMHAPLFKGVPNILLIGDSISMGYSFYEDRTPKCPPKASCQPDNRLGYGLYVKEMLANTTANWMMASVQHNGGWWLGGQAGDTKLGKSCIKSWLGSSSGEHAGNDGAYLPWDVIHVNFGLHDLNGGGKEVPVAEYVSNLAIIFAELQKTTAKLIFTTTTPVPVGDGGGTRTEANVLKYNEAALQLLAPDIASGRVAVNDLHGDVVARCGANYTATGQCELQIPANVHYEYEGREYCGLSVVRSILQALYKFGLPLGLDSPPHESPAAAAASTPPKAVTPQTSPSVEATCRLLAQGVRSVGGGRSSGCDHTVTSTCWYSASSMPLIGMIESATVFPSLAKDALPWAGAVLDSFLAVPDGPATKGTYIYMYKSFQV